MNGDSRRKAENQFQEIIQIKMEKNKAGEEIIEISHPVVRCAAGQEGLQWPVDHAQDPDLNLVSLSTSIHFLLSPLPTGWSAVSL